MDMEGDDTQTVVSGGGGPIAEENNDMQEDVREEAAPLVEEQLRGGAVGPSPRNPQMPVRAPLHTKTARQPPATHISPTPG